MESHKKASMKFSNRIACIRTCQSYWIHVTVQKDTSTWNRNRKKSTFDFMYNYSRHFSEPINMSRPESMAFPRVKFYIFIPLRIKQKLILRNCRLKAPNDKYSTLLNDSIFKENYTRKIT